MYIHTYVCMKSEDSLENKTLKSKVSAKSAQKVCYKVTSAKTTTACRLNATVKKKQKATTPSPQISPARKPVFVVSKVPHTGQEQQQV